VPLAGEAGDAAVDPVLRLVAVGLRHGNALLRAAGQDADDKVFPVIAIRRAGHVLA